VDGHKPGKEGRGTAPRGRHYSYNDVYEEKMQISRKLSLLVAGVACAFAAFGTDPRTFFIGI
jgi:hypothetical protein